MKGYSFCHDMKSCTLQAAFLARHGTPSRRTDSHIERESSEVPGPRASISREEAPKPELSGSQACREQYGRQGFLSSTTSSTVLVLVLVLVLALIQKEEVAT